MRFRATIRDEKTGNATHFVYVESENGHKIYACRFGWHSHAVAIANAMNAAWDREGRLFTREDAA